jgi:antitoxin component YwqK of YwqJK toxin-antitoxin module
MKKIIIALLLTGLVSCSNDMKKEYFENGKVQTELTVINGKKNGPAKAYYETGELKREGTYLNDLLEGKTTTYFISGKIETETDYKAGAKTGYYKEYYENGKPKAEAELKDGKQDGLTKEYYETGQLKAEKNFKNNLQDGNFVFYYPDGKLKMKATMENDKTTYYQEYDSLGGKGEEYREVRAEIASKNIKLGETYTAKITISGPTDNLNQNVSAGQSENIKDIKNLKVIEPNEKNELIYVFKPNKKGSYAWQILYIIKDKESNKSGIYTYEGVFECN